MNVLRQANCSSCVSQQPSRRVMPHLPSLSWQPWQQSQHSCHQQSWQSHQHHSSIRACAGRPLAGPAHTSSRSNLLQTLVWSLSTGLLALNVVATGAAFPLPCHAAVEDTFENIPGQLSSTGADAEPALSTYFKGAKRKDIEDCTRKCVPTCIRGGEGAPGLGPISMRKEIVVFKSGFRSRQYCLSECAQVCSLNIQGPPAAPAAAAAAAAAGGQQGP